MESRSLSRPRHVKIFDMLSKRVGKDGEKEK